MLAIAGIPDHENCEISRLILQDGGILDKIDEDMANGLCQAAAELLEHEEIDSAKKACLLALEITPEHALAHTVLGAIALSKGETSDAIRKLEIASRLGSEDAQQTLRLLTEPQSTKARSKSTTVNVNAEKQKLFGLAPSKWFLISILIVVILILSSRILA
jgi:lipopolysaccharide biosynthesis regulator YciM